MGGWAARMTSDTPDTWTEYGPDTGCWRLAESRLHKREVLWLFIECGRRASGRRGITLLDPRGNSAGFIARQPAGWMRAEVCGTWREGSAAAGDVCIPDLT